MPTGEVRPRSQVHAEGLYHRAVHVWLVAPSRGEVLLQLRAACKDSWPGRLDISCAGHISAGDLPLETAVRELQEELGLRLPPSRFVFLQLYLERLASVQGGRPFINNEWVHVYAIRLEEAERAELEPGAPAWSLQASEVEAISWWPHREVVRLYETGDARIVPSSDWGTYKSVLEAIAGGGLEGAAGKI